MNFLHRLPLFIGLGCAALATGIRAQERDADEGDDKRVQYQLVLPDEKTPENVKPEEHNPFESESEAQNRMAPGDTEENRVRDRLLKLPVVGTKRMPDGRMRVLLGNIILETGRSVPPVLPEQLVELKVKNITSEYIELAWQEKRATGLPPKLMIIPINISPRVRYQMLGQTGEEVTKGPNATMEMPLRDLAAGPPPVPSQTAPESGAGALPAPPEEMTAPKAQVVMDEPPAPSAPTVAEKTEPAAPPLSKSSTEPEAEPAALPETAPASASEPKPEIAAKTVPEPVAGEKQAKMRAAQPAPETPETDEQPQMLTAQPTPDLGEPAADEPAPSSVPAFSASPYTSPPPPSPAVESVVRMLFGNKPAPTPEPPPAPTKKK